MFSHIRLETMERVRKYNLSLTNWAKAMRQGLIESPTSTDAVVFLHTVFFLLILEIKSNLCRMQVKKRHEKMYRN